MGMPFVGASVDYIRWLASITGTSSITAPGSYLVTTLVGAVSGTALVSAGEVTLGTGSVIITGTSNVLADLVSVAAWQDALVGTSNLEFITTVLDTYQAGIVGTSSASADGSYILTGVSGDAIGSVVVSGALVSLICWENSGIFGTSLVESGRLITWTSLVDGTTLLVAKINGRLYSLLARGNMSELIYRQGGTLQLDEAFATQPTSATITIRTLDNKALSTIDSSFEDIEDVACACDDLSLTFAAANEQARVLVPTATSGTTIPNMTSPHYRMLINRGGRIYYTQVNEFDTQSVDGDLIVSSLRLDSPIPFALKAGDTGKGLRVAYTVDWSDVTSEWCGQVKATWKVLVDGEYTKITRIYDVVKQLLFQPATWSDILAVRPDADTQMSHVADKEALVTSAWNTIKQELYTMGIRHNLIISDEATTLRDSVVLQCLYNLTVHAGLPVPLAYAGQGQAYTDLLLRDKARALSLLQMPVDENEDLIVQPAERQTNRNTVFFRSRNTHRQRS